MISRFRHAALVGKYQAQGMRGVLEEIAGFLIRQGMEVSFESQTALNTGITGHGALTPDELGQHCDLAIVVGGDGTMLGIARQLSRYGTPLVGINQGRFGFITDVNVGQYAEVLAPMIAGGGGSMITWSGNFKRPEKVAKADQDDAATMKFISNVYRAGLDNVKKMVDK